MDTTMEFWSYGPSPSPLDLAEGGRFRRFLRLAVHVLVRLYMKCFHRLRFRHRKALRKLSRCLIVANHTSHLDVLALLSAFPLRAVNRIRSIAASDYFCKSPIRAAIASLLGNIIPMDRSRFDWRAMECCRKELDKGSIIIVFPEGTRSADGRMGHFQAGIGLMALSTEHPVLPARITGAYESWRKGQALPRRGRVKVRFGDPLTFDGLHNDKRNWRLVARSLESEVRGLAV